MKIKRAWLNLYLTFVLLMGICQQAMSVGREPQFSVNPFPLSYQMPSVNVQCMYQDKDGVVWLGTDNGLARYDGYRIHMFRSYPKQLFLLSNNEVTAIAETCDNKLLIGTSKGLNVMDKDDNFKITPFEVADLRDCEIRSIVTDDDGSIWVGTYKRLVRVSPDMKTVQAYDSKGAPVTSVNTLYKDAQGGIWVAFWEKGLFRYNRKKDRFDKMSPVGKKDNPFRLFQDRKGVFWVTTWGERIYRLDAVTGKSHPVKINGGGMLSLCKISTTYLASSKTIIMDTFGWWEKG